MEDHTGGLPIWQWVENKTCKELAEFEWLQKMAEETPIEELKKYHSAIDSILNLIEDLKKAEDSKNLEYFKEVLRQQKILAIIYRDKKKAKEVA